MSRFPSLRIGIPAATVLAVGIMAGGGTALAADSPEAAVNELFDIVASGDFAALDTAVCAADQAAAREAFDIGGQLGLDDGDPLAGVLVVDISERSVERVSEDGDSAIVRATASMSMAVDDDQLQDLVRAILEADTGPDDPPPSDADVEMMVGFMGSAFNQTQRIDEEVAVVREDGEWLVCGGLWEEPEAPLASAATWSSDGLCGLLDIDEVNAVGALQYATAMGFDVVCTISSSTDDWESYHSATLALNRGYDLATFEGVYPPDEELEVAGYPAFRAGDQVFVQVGDDALQVSVFLDEDVPEGVEAVTQAVGLAELVAPRLPRIAVATPEPTPEPTPEVSLCEALSPEELNDLTGLALDEASGDGSSCQYMSLGGEGGFHFVMASVNEADLELYKLWITEYEEITIAGLPAMATAEQTLVQLPDGPRVLDITVALDSSEDAPRMTAAEIGALVAERLLPGLLEQ